MTLPGCVHSIPSSHRKNVKIIFVLFSLIFDPFGGIGTVPYCAIRLGRKGLSTELNYDYWKDSLSYLHEAEIEVNAPTLFDLMEAI